MAFILEMVLTSWIDPFLWFKSMSALYVQKSKKRCIGSAFVCYAFIIAKDIISNTMGNSVLKVIVMVAIEFYLVLATVFLFEGRLYKKLISVFNFYCIMIATELFVFKCYVTLVPTDLDNIFQNRISYEICCFMITFLKAIACYCCFGSVKMKQFFYCYKERVFLAVMVIAMLFFLMSRSFSHRKQSHMSFVTDTLWLLLLGNAFSFSFVLKKKNNDISDLQQDIRKSVEQYELAQDIDRFKYGYAVNMLVLKNLFYNQDYDTFESYMEKVFTDVEKAELLFHHSNLAIRILMSGLIQTAQKMRVSLSVRILVQEFGMEDEEICSILQNLVKNGLEAAVKVPNDMARVSLQVLPNEDGYEIRCSNDCMGTVDFTKTSKRDKNAHGFGVGIVDKIVKKYSGIVTRRYLEREREGVGRVIISIYITL